MSNRPQSCPNLFYVWVPLEAFPLVVFGLWPVNEGDPPIQYQLYSTNHRPSWKQANALVMPSRVIQDDLIGFFSVAISQVTNCRLAAGKHPSFSWPCNLLSAMFTEALTSHVIDWYMSQKEVYITVYLSEEWRFRWHICVSCFTPTQLRSDYGFKLISLHRLDV